MWLENSGQGKSSRRQSQKMLGLGAGVEWNGDLKDIMNTAFKLHGMKSHWRILRECIEGTRCYVVEIFCDHCSNPDKA